MIYDSTSGVTIHSHAIRPIITLNSNVQIDTTKSGDGTSAETAYAIK